MKGYLYLIFIVLLAACEPDVKFAKALPPEVETIAEIPIQFQGTYMCESDSSRVFINRETIILESYYEFITSVSEVQETEDCSIVAGGLYLPGRKECIPFEYLSEDSIKARVYDLDTLIGIDIMSEALKMYKGHLYINKLNEDQNWSSWILSPQEDGGLLFSVVDVPDKKERVEEITFDYETRKKSSDEIEYVLNPSLVEFDRILDKDFITECEVLTPVNLEIKVFKN